MAHPSRQRPDSLNSQQRFIANLLDELGITWKFEPALTSKNASFTPNFHLSAQRAGTFEIYIEITGRPGLKPSQTKKLNGAIIVLIGPEEMAQLRKSGKSSLSRRITAARSRVPRPPFVGLRYSSARYAA